MPIDAHDLKRHKSKHENTHAWPAYNLLRQPGTLSHLLIVWSAAHHKAS